MKTKHTPQKRFIEVAQALKAGEKVTIEDLSAQELEFVMTMVNEPDILGFWELAKDEDINELKKNYNSLKSFGCPG